MPFKTYALLEQAKVAVRDAAARQGGRLATKETMNSAGEVCALGAMACAADVPHDAYNALCGYYGLTTKPLEAIFRCNDLSGGDPEAVLRVLDMIGVG